MTDTAYKGHVLKTRSAGPDAWICFVVSGSKMVGNVSMPTESAALSAGKRFVEVAGEIALPDPPSELPVPVAEGGTRAATAAPVWVWPSRVNWWR